MALLLTDGTARIYNLEPKSNPVRLARLVFLGDATYPGAAGSSGALQFLRDKIQAQDPNFNTSGAVGVVPDGIGNWLDVLEVVSFHDEDLGVNATKIVYKESTDTLVIKNRADDTLVGGVSDQSGTTFTVTVQFV